jgi:hypothetical protein
MRRFTEGWNAKKGQIQTAAKEKNTPSVKATYELTLSHVSLKVS